LAPLVWIVLTQPELLEAYKKSTYSAGIELGIDPIENVNIVWVKPWEGTTIYMAFTVLLFFIELRGEVPNR
jgi:hypothetical protein